MRTATTCLVLLGLGLTACMVPPTSSMRLTEAAYDLNTAARFGRMDIALEHVKDSAKEGFNTRHAGWGRAVRIVDYEFGGVSIRKDGDADVTLSVSWQRLDETTMRSTEISQRWTEKRGTWSLTSERESSGDRGLLAQSDTKKDDAKPADPGQPQDAAPTPAQQLRQRFQARTIYEQ